MDSFPQEFHGPAGIRFHQKSGLRLWTGTQSLFKSRKNLINIVKLYVTPGILNVFHFHILKAVLCQNILHKISLRNIFGLWELQALVDKTLLL